jgi:patatin-like phospholipase/acyl hydrolase
MNGDNAQQSSSSKFRILSLDGGGIKGTYTAAVLASIESMTGKEIWRHFDLITGTSTGGIIAVALGMGLPAKDVLKLYEDKGQTIFPVPRHGIRGMLSAAWQHLCGPKHSQEILKESIRAVIGDRKFGQSKVRLVIPAFDGSRGSIQLFKTAHTSEYKQDYLLPAIDVALGTSAAPTYYPAYTHAAGGCFVDGGVWANSPVMVGVLEAIGVLGHRIEDIEMLSIGTTSSPFDVSRARRNGGIASWNKGLIDIFMHAQGEAALGQARLLLRDRFLRVDTVTRPDRFSLDNSREIDDLKGLGVQEARKHEPEISRRFFAKPVSAFVPVNQLAEVECSSMSPIGRQTVTAAGDHCAFAVRTREI